MEQFLRKDGRLGMRFEQLAHLFGVGEFVAGGRASFMLASNTVALS